MDRVLLQQQHSPRADARSNAFSKMDTCGEQIEAVTGSTSWVQNLPPAGALLHVQLLSLALQEGDLSGRLAIKAKALTQSQPDKALHTPVRGPGGESPALDGCAVDLQVSSSSPSCLILEVWLDSTSEGSARFMGLSQIPLEALKPSGAALTGKYAIANVLEGNIPHHESIAEKKAVSRFVRCHVPGMDGGLAYHDLPLDQADGQQLCKVPCHTNTDAESAIFEVWERTAAASPSLLATAALPLARFQPQLLALPGATRSSHSLTLPLMLHTHGHVPSSAPALSLTVLVGNWQKAFVTASAGKAKQPLFTTPSVQLRPSPVSAQIREAGAVWQSSHTCSLRMDQGQLDLQVLLSHSATSAQSSEAVLGGAHLDLSPLRLMGTIEGWYDINTHSKFLREKLQELDVLMQRLSGHAKASAAGLSGSDDGSGSDYDLAGLLQVTRLDPNQIR
ncbi:hypothetical protein WJX73_009299 [Symbiochloris irregularis]|uniref:Uncharacterized protein n=1 Tax=Symbiochloris irregularis TaxID=706552 RepID=A0AAW1NSH3_9CHLO